jgi:DNA-binding transcriptional ArsR family regulator
MDRELLQALKALSDATRLRIVGLVAGRRMAVEELAAALDLTPPTVAHHLKRLREAGLVDASPRHPYVEYSLRVDRLAELGRLLDEAARGHAEPEARLAGPDGVDRPAFDAKVLASFIRDGRLQSIPTQEKKRLVVLRYLAETCMPEEREYPEKELNQALALVHPDVAALRRYLVDHGFAERPRSGVYLPRPRETWPT